jgi:hypothetical protein
LVAAASSAPMSLRSLLTSALQSSLHRTIVHAPAALLWLLPTGAEPARRPPVKPRQRRRPCPRQAPIPAARGDEMVLPVAAGAGAPTGRS